MLRKRKARVKGRNGTFGVGRVARTAWSTAALLTRVHRPFQKREKTGKEYGCFPFV